MKKQFSLFLCLALSKVFAQLPETEIFLADIEIKNNLIKIEKAENITNHKGYDNQPFFTADRKSIYFSSETRNKEVHISEYKFKTGKWQPLSAQDSTSDYSPMVSPDGKSIYCVVVEKDSSQTIWSYDNISPWGSHRLTPNTDSIGYYALLGKDSILYYKLTDPHSLRVLNLKTGEDNWLCDHPTRSFKAINNTTFFYVIHEQKKNLIYFYDIRTKKATLFATDKPENQDYVWQPDLGMIKSEGAKLLRYSTDTKVWVEVADFSSYAITKITRFTFSPDKKRLAVVSNLDK